MRTSHSYANRKRLKTTLAHSSPMENIERYKKHIGKSYKHNTIPSADDKCALQSLLMFGESRGQALSQSHGMRFMNNCLEEKSPNSENAAPFADKTQIIGVNQDTFV